MPADPPPVPTGLLFPLHERPTESYTTSPRSFGSGRKGGRKHAGCDLYAPVGTPIRAMAGGKVLTALYSFYGGTYALEVDHGTFVARYGEIQKEIADKLKVGDSVTPGLVIGQVGKLNNYHQSMLHLELYTGSGKGGLTDRTSKPYQRRADLFNPTTWLDAAK
ncbi:MAG: M23 family metallopeptidase [Myxococcales bacterium]|nr:M23 family metallopeptidase [Myxococcales bacterium]